MHDLNDLINAYSRQCGISRSGAKATVQSIIKHEVQNIIAKREEFFETEPSRKVVQIDRGSKFITALCNDGTIWVFAPESWEDADNMDAYSWHLMPNVPQPNEEKQP